jgi:hypothetical protein
LLKPGCAFIFASLSEINEFLDQLRLLEGPALTVREGRQGEKEIKAENHLILKNIKCDVFDLCLTDSASIF